MTKDEAQRRRWTFYEAVMIAEPHTEFAGLLRQARERAGLSLRALAQRVGLDASHLSRMETGGRRPRRSSALALAEALAIDGEALDQWLLAAGHAPVPLLTRVRGAVRTRGGVRRRGAGAPPPLDEDAHLLGRLEAMGLEEGRIRRLLQAMKPATAGEQQQVARAVSATLSRLADVLEAPVGTAVIPAAGGQHRLLAAHVMQRLLLQAIGEAAASGISNVVLVLATGTVEPLYAPLREAAELMIVPSLKIRCCEQAKPEGLGHAVLQAERLVAKGPFAVLLPDDVIRERAGRSVLPTELRSMMDAFAKLSGSPFLAVSSVPRAKMARCGVARLGPKEVRPKVFPVEALAEKPDLSHPIYDSGRVFGIVGRYLLGPDIFPALRALKERKERAVHLTDALEHLRRQGRAVYAFKLDAKREDVGELLDQASELMNNIRGQSGRGTASSQGESR